MAKCRNILLLTSIAAGTGMAFDGAVAQATERASGQPESIQLQDIVVTAQRREERLQDVPVAVSAPTADILDRANINSALNLNKIVPSVLIQSNQGTVTTFMRGVGNNIASAGNEPSNALYIDGIYYNRLAPVLFRLNNIDRIEVLKGPQGTLFGRNATSGLVQIVTREPVPGSAPQGTVRIGYGNYRTVEDSAYIATGLGEKVAADLSLLYYNQDKGWGINRFTGSQQNRERSFAARTKWIFEPTDRTKIVAVADYSYSTGDIGIAGPYQAPEASTPGLPDGSGRIPKVGFYDRTGDFEALARSRGYGGYVRIAQDLGFARLTEIISYRHLTQLYKQDADGSPQPAYAATLPSFSRQFSNELQLMSPKGSAVDWIVGTFYLAQKQGYDASTFEGTLFGGPASRVVAPASSPTKSYAGYAQATAPLIDTVRLTLGARYSRDVVKASGSTGLEVLGVGILPLVPFDTAKRTFEKVTWKGSIDYKPIENVLTYFSISRGYKAGLFNLLTFNPTPVKSEVLDSYELGVKSELFGRRIRINAAAFYYDWKNPQVEIVPAPGMIALTNAKAARVKGIEIETATMVSRRLTISAAGTFLDAKYSDFADAPSFLPRNVAPFGLMAGPAIDAAGNRLSRAPKYSASAGFLYKLPLATSEMDFGMNYAYTGDFYWHPDNRNKQRSYGLLDAQISYAFGVTGAKMKLWASNLTNVHYYTQQYELEGPQGDIGAPGAPRTYGVTLEYRF